MSDWGNTLMGWLRAVEIPAKSLCLAGNRMAKNLLTSASFAFGCPQLCLGSRRSQLWLRVLERNFWVGRPHLSCYCFGQFFFWKSRLFT